MIPSKHFFRLLLSLAVAFVVTGCIQNHPSGGGGSGGGGGTGGNGGNGGTGGIVSPECEPGSMFLADDDCNTCLCPESGLRAEAACTDRACPEVCEPGSTFDTDDGCNTCLCPDNGLRADAACTERECVSPCDELICGEVCTPQENGPIARSGDAPDGEPGFAPQVQYACNLEGQCVPEYEIDTCERVEACRDANCGDPCDPQVAQGAIPEESEQDPQPRQFFCDVERNCVPAGSETLACADRCVAKECGQPCRAPHLDRGEESGDRIPGSELCDSEGICVFVEEGGQLVCDGPVPCDGLSCGEPCFFEAEADRGPSGAPGDPQEPEQLVAPDGLCDVQGICRPVAESVDLMCDGEDRCRPGTTFGAADGCNSCLCPASGIRSEAVCTLEACDGPDPGCADLACGDICERVVAENGDSEEEREGASAPAPMPELSICDANLRCVWEHEHNGCGM